MLSVTREQAVAYRLAVNNVTRRLPDGSYVDAAFVGLQGHRAPRRAARPVRPRRRVCPTAWEDPGLVVRWTTSAVHVREVDLRLLGQDRTGLFVGPGLARHSPAQDSFHPNRLLVDGRVVGAWGRRGGLVDVNVTGSLPREVREAVEAEALSFPIPGAETTVRVNELS